MVKNFIDQKLQFFKPKQQTISIQSQSSCPSCKLPYDTESHIPMMTCKKPHFYCSSCHNKSQKNLVKCFVCHTCISKDEIVVFRQFINFIQKVNKIKDQSGKIHEQQQLILDNERKKKIKEQIMSSSIGQQIVLRLINNAKILFKFNNHHEASLIFESIIEINPQNDYGEFIGLGSEQQSIGYYEHKAYEWFIKNYAQRTVSVYDLLGLCNLSQPNYQAHKGWYEKMVKQYPLNVRLLYGLAITEHNADKFDEAMNLYELLIELQPTFSKPYQMLSFIMNRKSLKMKAFEFANKCLTLQPTNIFASLNSIRLNTSYSIQQKCQKILELYDKQKDYVYTIFVVGCLKIPSESISYWRKCNELNPFFRKAVFRLAQWEIWDNKNYQSCLQIISRTIEEGKIKQNQLIQCYKLKGVCYCKMQNWGESIYYLSKYFKKRKYNQQLTVSTYIVQSYFRLKQFEKSNSICKICLPSNILQTDCESPFQSFFLFQLALNYYYMWKDRKAIQIGLIIIQKNAPKPQKIYFVLASSYFSLKQYQQAQQWALKCIENKYEQAAVQVMRAQILQIKCQKAKAFKLAAYCLEEYCLSDYQMQRIEKIISRCSSQLLRSKKQSLKLKKQEKQAPARRIED